MKVEDHVIFTAKHRNWKVGDKLLDVDDHVKVAHFLSSVSNTVSMKIPEYLSDVINVTGVLSLVNETLKGDLAETLIALKSPGTSRKLNSYIYEEDKKLKKLLLDVAKALLVRETLSRFVDVYYPEEPLNEVRIVLPFASDHINFTAKHGKWIVVKRLIIDDSTQMADVARLLASINETITTKLPVYANIDVAGIEDAFSEFKKVKKSDIPKVVERFLEFQPSEVSPREFEPHARLYALRKAVETIGLPFDVPSKSLEKYLEKTP
ncbi:DUF2666 domain-containing protein [Thermococcus gorgonarius]|uniref:DUF2666 domain-containing protein n=1 Tax=Thermococcus gorgonarius TaxID=71997 RepID=A0A2Z2MBG5_THEGO|nr:DUF2666 domain-containing protein [Thermococcus gorgonarius]ASJ01254.1 hypothetical protein A3K92_07060 [Thermococcus gorgonarius]